MKKLDLNIKLEEPVIDDNNKEMAPVGVAIRWIGVMLERAINRTDPRTGRATVAVNMDTQRAYFKVMDALEHNNDGIVEIEDDVFNFLDRKFHQAEMPVQKGISGTLVNISNNIAKARMEVGSECKSNSR